MDEIQSKQLGAYFILILSALGVVFIEGIKTLELSIMWITFLATLWYAIDYIIAVIIYHFFKVKKEGLPWKIKSLLIGIGIGIIVIITAFGAVLIEWCDTLDISLTLLIFIGTVYYASESLVIGFIIHYFKIQPEDIPETIHTITEVDGDLYVDGSFTKTVPILTPTEPKEEAPEDPKPIE